ncbi:histidine kinase-DNA gyrase B-and HSP90-like ATPase-domain-containing protein [Fimicolochytrium jonesii]|uniref:histidine kinase-DNA gyrase B-and HSP90-like ATPase-domain-containing protein n=1 Tax=Fimicolochytrium jonesii TaxID=1396493 RepID=UPI0022FE872B|nr:histidine kinase-DNA gyrase B-and HSP90-like ATPase-domain-containing protein [Fimicolochytrium jonesii]KAI8822536.1 histidine kinase-DNA gyrase B-and HSP90-like ATPase-domain-containing protein [Fimicolochytrium jonesii]
MLALFTFICTVTDAFWKLGHSGFLLGPPFGYFLGDRTFGIRVGFLTVLMYGWSFYWSLGRQLPPLESHQAFWLIGDVYVITGAVYVLGCFDQLLECQKQLQDDVEIERKGNQAKTRFISSISHELRTPLHGILANVELLNDLCTTHSQRTLLATIECSGQNLLGIINQVLVYSKAESGAKQCQNVFEFDLFTLLEEVITSLAPVGFKKGLSVGYFIDISPAMRRVITSEGCLRQILVNLLGNSIKFTNTGSVELLVTDEDAATEENPLNETKTKSMRVKTCCDLPNQLRTPNGKECSSCDNVEEAAQESSSSASSCEACATGMVREMSESEITLEKAGVSDLHASSRGEEPQTDRQHKRRVTFTIVDTGCGIAEEFLEKMFSPFEQESTRKNRLIKDVEGTGLGLSIVKTLLDELGAVIKVDSTVGQGTTFRITLDLFYPSDTAWLDTAAQRIDGAFFEEPPESRAEFAERLNNMKVALWSTHRDAISDVRLETYLARWKVPYKYVDDPWPSPDKLTPAEKTRWNDLFKSFDMVVVDDVVDQLRFLDAVMESKDNPVIVYTTTLANFSEACAAAAPWDGKVRFALKPLGPVKLLPLFWEFLMSTEAHSVDSFDANFRKMIKSRGKLDVDLEMDQMRARYDLVGLGPVGVPPTDQDPTNNDSEKSPEENGSKTQDDGSQQSPAVEDDFRVLIAEDNPINQQILATSLSRKRLKHDIVENGQRAVDAWTEKRYQVVSTLAPSRTRKA